MNVTESTTLEIFDDSGVRLFYTESKDCIPDSNTISTMAKLRYKFKLNGKQISKTQLGRVLTK